MSENINQDVNIKGEGNIVVGRGDVIFNPLPPAEARERRDLGILLKNVDTTWIKGVLEHSVHEAALLELGMETRADAVEHPWQMVMETPDQERQVLPAGTKIKIIFEEANQLLLILGDPGSGKTTTLLQLARELMAEIDSAFTQPVPVIFNLSTWTDKRQPLADWLIVELQSKYRVPKKQGSRWLEKRRILPLLDGLDEVKSENRAACIEQINTLVVEFGLQGVVVCSRIQDYTALNVRLKFNRAISLQSLTSEQLDQHFEKAGGKLSGLQATLLQDEALQSLAKSPLMLNIMSLAYQDSSVEALHTFEWKSNEARRQNLFDLYIARMFKRKGTGGADKIEQTKQRLSWLAKNMQHHNQEVFLIENLQPSWLITSKLQFLYILTSRLPEALIASLIIVLLVCLILSPRGGYQLFTNLINGVITLGLPGLIICLISWLLVSVIDFCRFIWREKLSSLINTQKILWPIANIALVGLVIGLIGGQSVKQIFGLGIGLGLGLSFASFGLFFGLRGSRQTLTKDIQTVEALRWDWIKMIKGGATIGLVSGIIFRLLAGLGDLFSILFNSLSEGIAIRLNPVNELKSNIFNILILFADLLSEIFKGLSKWLSVGLLGGLVGAAFYGLRRDIVETKTTPNQGVRLSIRNSLLGGTLLGLFFGVLGCFSGGVFYGLVSGLTFWLIGVLLYGGLDAIQHYTLRLIITIQGYTPLNYIRFLDFCVDLIFLQKVGGGYRFIHRMLLEHFAEMEHTPLTSSSHL